MTTTVTSLSDSKEQDIINNLIKLAHKEINNGNKSITPDKLDKLTDLLVQKKIANKSVPVKQQRKPHPQPKYPSLVNKFDLNKASSSSSSRKKENKKVTKFYKANEFSFRKVEFIFITILENLANLMDNLHLLSNLPMFPKFLNNFLKQTNKIWIFLLLFLIRKTISQLLNVLRKIRKVNVELDLLNKTTKDHGLTKKYNKVLKDLKFDKMMLVLELIGNFLDLTFNVIEFYGVDLPGWVMSILNFSSMAMTIYRMNKDDEYVDDDISEDLI
ncbi:hypothetical protein SBY92_003693 [Candida maltosa Xu316]